jgi:flagellar hook-associated protein 1 FlgK
MGISTALSSLRTQRVAIDVAGQNIANVNTPGYARQRVALTAGIGVDVSSIQRLYSGVLGNRSRTEEAQLQDFTVNSTVLKEIEQVFAEPSAYGLQSKLDAMWSGFADVARDPSNRAARIQVLAQANDVTRWLNDANTNLTDIATANQDSLRTLVSTVNGYAKELSRLNVAISQSVEGTNAMNSLLDQRTQLAQQIAQAVGGTFTTNSANMMSVALGGGTLVSPNAYQTLKVSTTGGTTSVQWENDSSTATISSGTASGHLTATNDTVGKWRTELNGVAAALVSKVNGVHTTGYDLNGTLGTAFFTAGATTAANISVAITDGLKIAASAVAPVLGVASLDGSKADALAQLSKSTDGPNQNYQNLVVSLGVAVQSATQSEETQKAMASSISSQINTESGVSIDEEMTNLLAYQRAYEAAARVLNAIDSVLDTLINRTGLVGR